MKLSNLGFNKKNNSLIILELKTGKADYNTFGQILFYLLNAEVVEYVNNQRGRPLIKFRHFTYTSHLNSKKTFSSEKLKITIKPIT